MFCSYLEIQFIFYDKLLVSWICNVRFVSTENEAGDLADANRAGRQPFPRATWGQVEFQKYEASSKLASIFISHDWAVKHQTHEKSKLFKALNLTPLGARLQSQESATAKP